MDCVLIGYGYWGQIIERYIRESEDFRLLGICDHHKEDGIALQDVIDRLDCAFVCVPTREHFAVAEELLTHGIHVFCEKPLCGNLQDTKRLVALAKENRCILFTDYTYMVSPSLGCMKQYLHQFGRILHIDMAIRQFGRFYSREHVYETVGVHMLSVLACLFEDEPLTIERVDSVACDSGGYTQAGFIYFEAAGAHGRIECNLLAERKDRTVRILCEKGLLIFDMLGEHTIKVLAWQDTDAVKEMKESRTVLQEHFDEGNNLRQMIALFARTIREGGDDNSRITLAVQGALEEICKGLNVDEI